MIEKIEEMPVFKNMGNFINIIDNLKRLGWLHEPMQSIDSYKLLDRYVDDLSINQLLPINDNVNDGTIIPEWFMAVEAGTTTLTLEEWIKVHEGLNGE